jgi:hypothetical protein
MGNPKVSKIYSEKGVIPLIDLRNTAMKIVNKYRHNLKNAVFCFLSIWIKKTNIYPTKSNIVVNS